MNPSKTLKLLLAASAALLTASTQAVDLKIGESETALSKIFKYSSGEWANVTMTKTPLSGGGELYEFIGNMKNGDIPTGTSGIALLDTDKTVSDVIDASWALHTVDRKSYDSFDIKMYSDAGWPSVPDSRINEPSKMDKVMHIPGGAASLNIFVNSPEPKDPAAPDGGTTAGLLGLAFGAVAMLRRKISA
jgi:hypothetical protein